MDEEEAREILAEEIGKIPKHPAPGGYCAVAAAIEAVKRAYEAGIKAADRSWNNN